jgi:hypothetical protein
VGDRTATPRCSLSVYDPGSLMEWPLVCPYETFCDVFFPVAIGVNRTYHGHGVSVEIDP